MALVTKEAVMEALSQVNDPELGRPITELNMVRGVEIEGGKVTVGVALTVAGCPLQNVIEDQVSGTVGRLEGVESVKVVLDVMTDEERKALVEKLQGPQRKAKSRILDADSKTQIIAVASGKGGVGKSTVTVNLALALAMEGYQVGVIDADIYGFSVPRMLGVKGRPVALDQAIVPMEGHGLQVMSMGFFVDDHTPVIWRGPMLAGAMEQFLNDVLWADLDFLLVDLPPGTGDVPLTLAQKLPDAKMLLVTTPNGSAFHVASRAGYLAKKSGQEIIGVVENMSYLICEHCGEKQIIFGEGGGEALADELDTRLLGQIPLEPKVRAGSDEGKPVMIADPDSPAAKEFLAVARRVAAKAGKEQAAAAGSQ